MALFAVAVPVHPASGAASGPETPVLSWSIPPAGRGYLAGEAPDGLTTIEGVPTDAELRVIYRPASGALGDGVIVQRLSSAPDGTWTAWGLNPDLRYDVIARKAGQNDVIMSDVAPVSYDIITIDGDFALNEDGDGIAGVVEVFGGIGAYTVSVIDGVSPPGLIFSVVNHMLVYDGRVSVSGDYAWTVEISTPNGASGQKAFAVNGIVANSDPHYANVVSLLHLDGVSGSASITDETGRTWFLGGTARIDSTQAMFNQSLKFDSAWSYIFSENDPAFLFGDGDFTVEMFIRPASLSSIGSLASVWSDGNRAWVLYQVNGGLQFSYSTNGYSQSNAFSVSSGLSVGAWHHIAVTCESGVIRGFIDGVQIGTSHARYAAIHAATERIEIGSQPMTNYGQYIGHMDEIRITKGVCRYNANFTPPSIPFANS